MYCQNCGKELGGAAFCGACGAPATSLTMPQQQTAQNSGTNAAEQQNTMQRGGFHISCWNCGSTMLYDDPYCPVCGARAEDPSRSEGAGYGGGYRGTARVAAVPQNTLNVKPRSKKVAIALACVGANDLYLFNYTRLFKKVGLLLLTAGIGTAIWQVMDIINLVNGKINCDANGTPIV